MSDTEGMSALGDALWNIGALIQRQRFESLRTKLDLCCTFVNLAKSEHKTGNLESAKRYVAAAEKGHEGVARFLSDPEYDVSHDQREALQTRLHQLRDALNRLWVDSDAACI